MRLTKMTYSKRAGVLLLVFSACHLLFAKAVLAQSTTESTTESTDRILDEIIAVVNNGVVLHSELVAESNFLRLQAKSAGQSLPNDKLLKERVLERLINHEIQRQRAKELGIEVDQPSINQAIERISAGNKMTTFDFRTALEAEGFDYSYYRKSIRQELLVSRLIQRDVGQSINISEQEIDDFLSSSRNQAPDNKVYRLSHILIAQSSSSNSTLIASARSKASTVAASIRNGAAFDSVARKVSEGPKALSGGDLGWRKLVELPQFLHETVKTTAKGNVSEPIQSPDGFHIIKIEGIRTAEKETTTETLIRHIFISDNSESYKDKGLETLEAVVDRLNAGEAFASLASEYSEDPNSSTNGGELPWFVAGEMPQEIDSVAKKLQKNSLSKPFRTRFGWHVLEVLDRRTTNLSDQKQRRNAELNLRQRKLEQESTRWSRRLRDEAFVELKGDAQ